MQITFFVLAGNEVFREDLAVFLQHLLFGNGAELVLLKEVHFCLLDRYIEGAGVFLL